MAKAKAKWAVAVTKRSVDAAGTMHVEATASDDGTPVADLALTIDADRALKLLVTNRPGAAGFSGFEAWMTEATP
jgi:hypothetical protein